VSELARVPRVAGVGDQLVVAEPLKGAVGEWLEGHGAVRQTIETGGDEG
jgi:hypothetical protein